MSRFEQLVALAIGLLVFGYIIEGSLFGVALLRSFDRPTRLLRRYTEVVVRVVAGGFFTSLWATQHVLLTPELTTTLGFVPWLQLAIAAAMLWRRILPLAAREHPFVFVAYRNLRATDSMFERALGSGAVLRKSTNGFRSR